MAPASCPQSPRLTDRQTEVARLVGQGLSYKAIAMRLGLSVRTVERHVHRLAHKLGVNELTPYRRVQHWAFNALNKQREAV